jgi:hypothetical protein
LAPGRVPDPRSGHSAVLGNYFFKILKYVLFYLFNLIYFIVEDKICIFGGLYYYDGQPNTPKESIAMLNTSVLRWSIPQFKNPKRQNLPNLFYHTATLIDKRMLLAFGKLFF